MGLAGAVRPKVGLRPNAGEGDGCDKGLRQALHWVCEEVS